MKVVTTADVGSFESLYRVELRPITALASSMTGSRELGRDIAHEALLRAYRDWARVATLDNPGAWVRRVAVNLAIDVQRRRARERIAVARAGSRLAAAPVDDPLADATSTRFWALVRALPDQQRAVVALRYLDDLAVQEIAEILAIPVGTVKSQLFKARHALATALSKEPA